MQLFYKATSIKEIRDIYKAAQIVFPNKQIKIYASGTWISGNDLVFLSSGSVEILEIKNKYVKSIVDGQTCYMSPYQLPFKFEIIIKDNET